jgi:hypothetical protein
MFRLKWVVVRAEFPQWAALALEDSNHFGGGAGGQQLFGADLVGFGGMVSAAPALEANGGLGDDFVRDPEGENSFD